MILRRYANPSRANRDAGSYSLAWPTAFSRILGGEKRPSSPTQYTEKSGLATRDYGS